MEFVHHSCPNLNNPCAVSLSRKTQPGTSFMRMRKALAASGLLGMVRAVVGILRYRLDCIYEFTN